MKLQNNKHQLKNACVWKVTTQLLSVVTSGERSRIDEANIKGDFYSTPMCSYHENVFMNYLRS